MRPHSEKGGVLLELVIVAFILASFAAGSARIHAALRNRFERIVRERNELIRSARGAGGRETP